MDKNRAVTWLFVAAVACMDFSPLHVYRYFLASDALLLAALFLQLGPSWNGRLYGPKLVEALFALYLVSTGIAFVRPVEPGIGLGTWLHSAFLMLVYVPAATTLLVIRPDLRRLVLPTLFVATTLQALAIAQAVAGGLTWESGKRLTGAFGSVQLWPYAASVAGGFALLALGSWPTRVGALVGLAALATAEMFLRSRMLWVASILAVCFFAVMQERHKGRAIVLGLLLCAALTGAYALDLYPDAVHVRIAAVLNPSQASDLVERVKVVNDLSDAVIDSPMIGLGVNQSPEYLGRLPLPPRVVYAHNIILHAAAEGGILAAVALALLPLGIAVLWKAAARGPLTPGDRLWLNWSCASLLAIYVAAQLTPTLYEHTFYFLLSLLASLAYSHASVGGPAIAQSPGTMAGAFRVHAGNVT